MLQHSSTMLLLFASMLAWLSLCAAQSPSNNTFPPSPVDLPPYGVYPSILILPGNVSVLTPTIFQFRRLDISGAPFTPDPNAAALVARFTDTAMDGSLGVRWMQTPLVWDADHEAYCALVTFRLRLGNNTNNNSTNTTTTTPTTALRPGAGSGQFSLRIRQSYRRPGLLAHAAGTPFAPVLLHWQLSLDGGVTFSPRMVNTQVLSAAALVGTVSRPVPQAPVRLIVPPSLHNALHPWAPFPSQTPRPDQIGGPPIPAITPRMWVLLRSSGGNRIELTLQSSTSANASNPGYRPIDLASIEGPGQAEHTTRSDSSVDDFIAALRQRAQSEPAAATQVQLRLRFSLQPNPAETFDPTAMVDHIGVVQTASAGTVSLGVTSPDLSRLYSEAHRRYNASGFAVAYTVNQSPGSYVSTNPLPALVGVFLHVSMDGGATFHGPLDAGADFALQQTAPARIAYLYPGRLDDFGWTFAHHSAKLLLEDHYSSALQSTHFENVALGMTGRAALVKLMQEGQFDLVLMCSSGFYEVAKSIAQDPEALPSMTHLVVFAQSGEVVSQEQLVLPSAVLGSLRMHLATAEQYLARYLAGIVAGGYAAEKGESRIGYVAAFQAADVLVQLNAFVLGVRRQCPSCLVFTKIIQSWGNPYQERECARSFIEMGFRIIAHHTDNKDAMLAVEAAANAGVDVVGIGSNSNMLPIFVGERVLTAPYYVWTDVHQYHIQNYLDRVILNQRNDPYTNWKLLARETPASPMATEPPEARNGSMSYVGNLASGSAALAPLSRLVPRSTRVMLEKARAAAMRASNLGVQTLYCGPMRDSEGTLRLADSASCLSAADIGAMDWFVEGVSYLGNFAAPPPEHEQNRIAPLARAVMYTFLFTIVVATLVLSVYVQVYRAHPVLKASSPNFLQIVLLGALLVLLSGAMLGVDEDIASQRSLDSLCIAVPCFLSLGFMLLYGALFIRLWRVLYIIQMPRANRGAMNTTAVRAGSAPNSGLSNAASSKPAAPSQGSALHSAEKPPQKPVHEVVALPPRVIFSHGRRLSDSSLAGLLMGFCAPALAVLLTWGIGPHRPTWTITVHLRDADGFPRQSTSSCSGPYADRYWAALECLAVLMLVGGLVLAYRARNVPSRFSESKWLGLCMVNLLQVLLVLVPLQFLLDTATPTALYILRGCTITLTVALLLIFLFAPKLLLMHSQKLKASKCLTSIMGRCIPSSALPSSSAGAHGFNTSTAGAAAGRGLINRGGSVASSVGHQANTNSNLGATSSLALLSANGATFKPSGQRHSGSGPAGVATADSLLFKDGRDSAMGFRDGRDSAMGFRDGRESALGDVEMQALTHLQYAVATQGNAAGPRSPESPVPPATSTPSVGAAAAPPAAPHLYAIGASHRKSAQLQPSSDPLTLAMKALVSSGYANTSPRRGAAAATPHDDEMDEDMSSLNLANKVRPHHMQAGSHSSMPYATRSIDGSLEHSVDQSPAGAPLTANNNKLQPLSSAAEQQQQQQQQPFMSPLSIGLHQHVHVHLYHPSNGFLPSPQQQQSVVLPQRSSGGSLVAQPNGAGAAPMQSPSGGGSRSIGPVFAAWPSPGVDVALQSQSQQHRDRRGGHGGFGGATLSALGLPAADEVSRQGFGRGSSILESASSMRRRGDVDLESSDIDLNMQARLGHPRMRGSLDLDDLMHHQSPSNSAVHNRHHSLSALHTPPAPLASCLDEATVQACATVAAAMDAPATVAAALEDAAPAAAPAAPSASSPLPAPSSSSSAPPLNVSAVPSSLSSSSSAPPQSNPEEIARPSSQP